MDKFARMSNAYPERVGVHRQKIRDYVDAKVKDGIQPLIKSLEKTNEYIYMLNEKNIKPLIKNQEYLFNYLQTANEDHMKHFSELNERTLNQNKQLTEINESIQNHNKQIIMINERISKVLEEHEESSIKPIIRQQESFARYLRDAVVNHNKRFTELNAAINTILETNAKQISSINGRLAVKDEQDEAFGKAFHKHANEIVDKLKHIEETLDGLHNKTPVI